MFGYSPLPRTLPAALRDLCSAKVPVRRAAITDLARFTEGAEREAVVRAIAERFKQEPLPVLRVALLLTIADGEFSELLPTVTGALADADGAVKQHALLALGELADDVDASAHALVSPYLASEQPALRYQALVTWTRLKGTDGQRELEQGLADSDAEVRWIALRLLEEQDWPLTEKLEQRLTLMLSDPERRVRDNALLLLAWHSRGNACEQMLSLLDKSEFSLTEERRCYDVVLRHQLHAARPTLERRALRRWVTHPLRAVARQTLAALSQGRRALSS